MKTNMQTTAIASVTLVLIALSLLLAGCAKTPVTNNTTLYNQTLNEQLDNLTDPGTDGFVPFMINVTPRDDARYEISEDDIFALAGENLTSSDVAFLGIKLGDSAGTVNQTLGPADVDFGAKDGSFRNLEFRRAIGIADKLSGITYHIENGTVTQISVRQPLNKYLHGNTTIGTAKETIYSLLGLPDYTDFTSTQRVMHYVENGVDVYLKGDEVEVLSFYKPKVFKGVVYRSVATYDPATGIVTNVTKPFLIE